MPAPQSAPQPAAEPPPRPERKVIEGEKVIYCSLSTKDPTTDACFFGESECSAGHEQMAAQGDDAPVGVHADLC